MMTSLPSSPAPRSITFVAPGVNGVPIRKGASSNEFRWRGGILGPSPRGGKAARAGPRGNSPNLFWVVSYPIGEDGLAPAGRPLVKRRFSSPLSVLTPAHRLADP